MLALEAATHLGQFLSGVPRCLGQYLEQGLLVGQHLPPLDLDLDGLPLPRGGHAGLLEHGCRAVTGVKPARLPAKLPALITHRGSRLSW